MSHWNPNVKFDYENWRQQQIAKRARAALDARDAAFAEQHADTPLEELAPSEVALPLLFTQQKLPV